MESPTYIKIELQAPGRIIADDRRFDPAAEASFAAPRIRRIHVTNSYAAV
jgi:hypothetical protein